MPKPKEKLSKTAVLSELKAAGTDQNRKVYARHGVQGSMYGVSYAALGKLSKRIRQDHTLAVALWKTGNHDARILATMVADPAEMSSALVDEWVKDLSNYVLTDAFSGLVAKSKFRGARAKKWSRSTQEWVGATGWNLVAYVAMQDDDANDDDLLAYLDVIEKRIHSRKNRVRHSMNAALIAIGMRNPGLESAAIAAAERIGKVEVDHGETSCKTPDAIPYIKKGRARKRPR